MISRRQTLKNLTLAAAWPSWPSVAIAASPGLWPQRPLRLLVVYPPGGVSDWMARMLAEPLAERLGQAVLVEHRAGAGGAVGMAALARAAADGHTLAFSAISPITLHPLIAHPTYNAESAFTPVVAVMRTPVLVVGTPAFTGRNFSDLIALARVQPGRLRWASSGVATTGHLVLAQIQRQSGVQITHVPYQGGGAQLNDALSGQFEVLSTNLATQQLQYIAARRLTPLAVGSMTRLEALPTVPTLMELGFVSANLDSLFGLFAPAGTPPGIVQRLHTEVTHILASASLQRSLREAHNLPAGGSSEDFAREIANDRRRNTELIGHDRRQFE